MTTKTTAAVTKAQFRQEAAQRKAKAARRRAFWKSFGNFLTSRSRDLALAVIVIGAFVAVFDGSLYSATKFGFTGWSAIAFAVAPDALMVLSAAKMRQVGITAAQHATAKATMRYALGFSLASNMIAAFMKFAPQLITAEFLLIGAVAYHGVVVMLLWRAVETLTKTRADRKAPKASKADAPATQSVPAAQHAWNPQHASA